MQGCWFGCRVPPVTSTRIPDFGERVSYIYLPPPGESGRQHGVNLCVCDRGYCILGCCAHIGRQGDDPVSSESALMIHTLCRGCGAFAWQGYMLWEAGYGPSAGYSTGRSFTVKKIRTCPPSKITLKRCFIGYHEQDTQQ